jgi:magnesium transporter
MLYVNSDGLKRILAESERASVEELGGAVWIDLLHPTEQERSDVERATHLRVPVQADLAEIESSSRLLKEHDTFYLSTPMIHRSEGGETTVAPLGFVLSPERLITARFSAMPVFDDFADRFAASKPRTSAHAFVGLLEGVVDRLADVLEMVAAELEKISHRIFRGPKEPQRNAAKLDAELRGTLRSVGQAGERLGNLRDSLVGMQRIIIYVHEMGVNWIEPDLLHRCNTVRQDIASLADYDVQLNNKVQFLLDATLGFINIEQNNGIKILTVVSVVGVPPTLVASIYGMNFKWIPELQWDYGYFYGLGMIVASAILPLVWFKKRGWI